MPETVNRSEIEELKNELQRFADTAAEKCPKVSDAAFDLITAINYEDEALVHSSYTSLLTSLAELANEWIAKELEISVAVQKGLTEGWKKYVDKKAFEIAMYDEIKDTIESIIDERSACMLKLRRLVNHLKEQEVENAQALEDGIRDLRRFREDFLKGWPSCKSPTPIDQSAITKAREGFAHGQKGLTKNDLIWGNTRVAK